MWITHLWNGLPSHIQTPLIQAGGAAAASLIALVGVRMTLKWNLRKHIEDRNIALKKAAFAKFLGLCRRSLRRLRNYAGDYDGCLFEELSEALGDVELVAASQSREAAYFVLAQIQEMDEERKPANSNYVASFNYLAASKEQLYEAARKADSRLNPSINLAKVAFRAELGIKPDATLSEMWDAMVPAKKKSPEELGLSGLAG